MTYMHREKQKSWSSRYLYIPNPSRIRPVDNSIVRIGGWDSMGIVTDVFPVDGCDVAGVVVVIDNLEDNFGVNEWSVSPRNILNRDLGKQ